MSSAPGTQLATAQEKLVRAERLSALGTLAAGLAHELRTPIAGVKGALDILASRARPGTPEAEFTGVASRELIRLGALLEEFLAYARPRAPARIPVRLAELLTQVEAVLSSEARVRDVRVEVRADTPGDITGDPAQLTQVLLNVIANAIQASPEASAVQVTVRQVGEQFEVEVIDRGPGVPPDAVGRVFEPFFTTKARGTGLGLAIAQRIVLAHGGTIDLVNGNPGTCALIRLPRAANAGSEAVS
jgi:signal transduction histidine kinase